MNPYKILSVKLIGLVSTMLKYMPPGKKTGFEIALEDLDREWLKIEEDENKKKPPMERYKIIYITETSTGPRLVNPRLILHTNISFAEAMQKIEWDCKRRRKTGVRNILRGEK